jgi:hypothetical protein
MCFIEDAMGMLAADGDESAMVALFVRECVMEVSMTSIFFVPCVSHNGGILGPTMLIVSKKIGGKSTVGTTEVGFKLSEYYAIRR